MSEGIRKRGGGIEIYMQARAGKNKKVLPGAGSVMEVVAALYWRRRWRE
jgi:hypothetical protein